MANYKNPVLKKGKHTITSPFGPRVIFGKKQTHTGIDFVGANNAIDDIIAFAEGKVTISKYSTTAGEYVQIDHGNNIYTRYLHMENGSRKVRVGAKVKKGQVLGRMGSTGNSTGPHLHFDININGTYVDPEPYLKGTKTFKKAKIKKDKNVLNWQKAAKKDKFIIKADGFWGEESETVASKAICKKRDNEYRYKNLTKIVQKAVGVKADGKFGSATEKAVKKYQKLLGLNADGIVGLNTWKKILGIKS